MKPTRLVGLLAVLLLTSWVSASRPVQAAENVIVYVRNQVYTQPTMQQGKDIYISLQGLLEAMRFGWKVQGSKLVIIQSGNKGTPLAGNYSYEYRGKAISLPTKEQDGRPWVSLSAAAGALGAGYQYNSTLQVAEVYFAPTARVDETPKAEAPKADAAPPAEAPKTDTPPAEAPKADAAPAPAGEAPKAADASKGTPPAADAPKADTPKADEAKKDEPKKEEEPPEPVEVSRKITRADYASGRIYVDLEVTNPAKVVAKDVNVLVSVKDASGTEIYHQYWYIGDMAAEARVTKTIEGDHPDTTSMPRGIYEATADVTFKR